MGEEPSVPVKFDSFLSTSYLAALPLLLICCLLNFSISYNIEAANMVVSMEIHSAAERLSIANELHFYYRELFTTTGNGTQGCDGTRLHDVRKTAGYEGHGLNLGTTTAKGEPANAKQRKGNGGTAEKDENATSDFKTRTSNERKRLRPFWTEENLRSRIAELLAALEQYHYVLRFGGSGIYQ